MKKLSIKFLSTLNCLTHSPIHLSDVKKWGYQMTTTERFKNE
jgi:hypothetical protein